MYDFFLALSAKPAPFSVSTVSELWTRPHLAKQMLAFHLDPDTPLASRSPEEIGEIVNFIDTAYSLRNRKLCDLGCGPGLYAREFAARGARVFGMDISTTSVDHATANVDDGAVFRVGDYLVDEIPPGFDMVCLIYTDYCSLSPGQRLALLEKVRAALVPGGLFILDVNALPALATMEEGAEIGFRTMNGFWSDNDYVGIQQDWIYPEERLSLTRFTIVEPGETWSIYNWRQFFSLDSITGELASKGFEILEAYSDLKGSALDDDSPCLGLVARAS